MKKPWHWYVLEHEINPNITSREIARREGIDEVMLNSLIFLHRYGRNRIHAGVEYLIDQLGRS